ncbi:MAG: energy-coupling factor ABC transporter ATP-binding protein [Chloroflexota bacterium]
MLRGCSLDIHAGEIIGIVGTTGAGKSTLCLTLNGLAPHYTGGVMEGSVLVNGTDTRRSTVAELSASVGLVFQDADSQLVMSTVEEECLLAPLSQGCSRSEARERALQALQTLEIGHLAQRSPRALSGGQKQRTAIAAVLAAEPAMLVLDEATSELDALMVQKLFEFCRDLNQNRGTTIVIVTHEMEHLAEHASRILLMSEGRVILDGPPRAVFAERGAFNAAGVRLPQAIEIYHRLGPALGLSAPPLGRGELETALRKMLGPSV